MWREGLERPLSCSKFFLRSPHLVVWNVIYHFVEVKTVDFRHWTNFDLSFLIRLICQDLQGWLTTILIKLPFLTDLPAILANLIPQFPLKIVITYYCLTCFLSPLFGTLIVSQINNLSLAMLLLIIQIYIMIFRKLLYKWWLLVLRSLLLLLNFEVIRIVLKRCPVWRKRGSVFALSRKVILRFNIFIHLLRWFYPHLV